MNISSFKAGAAALAVALGGQVLLAGPIVSNIRVSQRANSKLVDIVYDLADTSNAPLNVTFSISADAGSNYNVPAVTFYGNAGVSQWPGSNLLAVWDAGKDWNRQYSTNVKVRIMADEVDPRNPDPLRFACIRAGTYVAGSPTSETGRDSIWEVLQTNVLTNDFLMSKYEVTQGEFLSVMGTNYSYFTGNTNLPAESMTWFAATNYCVKLTIRERAAGRLPTGWGYRLPTMAEWEYACRAGTTNAFYYGNELRGGMANFDNRYEYSPTNYTNFVASPTIPYQGKTVVVGSYAPNAWGLYDMHGNVAEFCQDGYNTGMQIPYARGGGWNSGGVSCRSASHLYNLVTNQVGFRPVIASGQ